MTRTKFPLLLGAMLLALAAGLGLGSVLSGPLNALALAADAQFSSARLATVRESAPAPGRASAVVAAPQASPKARTAVPDKISPARETPAASSQTAYTVRAASFRTERRAQAMAAELRAKGLDASVQALKARKGSWYVVRVGQWATPGQAREQARAVSRTTGQPTLVSRISGPALSEAKTAKSPDGRITARMSSPGQAEAMARLERGGVEAVVGRDRTRKAAEPARQPSDWAHLVQAGGAFEPKEARTLANDLSARGVPASILYLHGWYVVEAGLFETREEAKARADAVRRITGREPSVTTASRRTVERCQWTPGPDEEGGPAPQAANSRELMYTVENWGRPDLSRAALVASFADPRTAGATARKLESQGIAALVVFQDGQSPWRVYRKTGQATP